MARLMSHMAAEAQPEPLSVEELERAVRAADPAAFLVPPRILRRVVKQHSGVAGIGLRVPHRKTYVIAREDLLTIVDRGELDLESDAELPENVILIARPSNEALANLSPGQALLKFWRQLFHARVHLVFDQLAADGKLDDADIQSFVREIGEIEFEEIRGVLRQEDYLLPPRSDRQVCVEFAAVYLELRHFVPTFLRSYFPGLQDFHHVDELLKAYVDAEALLAATRPTGAPDPHFAVDVPSPDHADWEDRPDEPQAPVKRISLPVGERSPSVAVELVDRANLAAKRGNLVRAAILRTRAAAHAHPEVSHVARDQARADLARLAHRLQAALGFTNNEAEEWVKSLNSLLEQAARGFWAAEARMLYDLQKVCVDHERGIYALDLIGWVTSFGRKPFKRFLPGQRDVLISKHLQSAEARLPSARLSHRSRSRLAALLHSAVHRAETALRARFRPPIDKALDTVKLLPQNSPERVARKKLVDEILDRIVERGFLSMGDLRDSISRNNLKLPDLASVKQFLLGDQLLQADRQLAASLDGVYRGGEIYRRFPQRLSSLAFGTPVGRFLTLYAALPFGGAYIILHGLHEAWTRVIVPAWKALDAEAADVVDTAAAVGQAVAEQQTAAAHAIKESSFLVHPATIILLGCVIFSLMHQPRVRAACLEMLVRIGQGFRWFFVDLPRALLQLPLVQRVVRSWQFKFFRRYVFKPLVIAGIISPGIDAVIDRQLTLRSFALIFLGVNLLVNSRIGRNVDEMVTDWVVHTWHRLRIHVFAALFRLIMDVFNRVLEAIERLLYTVDELLRFRTGESRRATVAKAVLGFVWFFVNYVIRFCVNLLIEPQINPIKHFPVVTVSHKFLIPYLPALTRALTPPLGSAGALAVAPTIIFLTPGMFGFLAWELKENWRLYAANRPRDIGPVSIGHHGETMLQLIKPGFRSGTVPKLYAKLRSASRKAYWSHNWKGCTKQLKALHHVNEALRRFVDRELLALLHESRNWSDRSITTGEVRLGCNRILVELYCPDLTEESLWLAFEDQEGWLVATVYSRGWVDVLSLARRNALSSALAGFYKMAGVDLAREQIEARIEPSAPGYKITDEALLVWPSRQAEEQVYPLGDWPTLEERVGAAAAEAHDRERWVFAAIPVPWRKSVVYWELDQLGGISKHPLLEDVTLLPT